MKRLASIALCIALAACSKKKADDTAVGSAGSAVAMETGSGSAMATGSGSGSATAAAGSGSAAATGAGSGSATGAGPGSAVAAGSDMGRAGSGSGSAVAAGSGSATGSATAPEKEKTAFQKMTDEEKAEFMKTKVVPPMKEAFQKFDAKKFAKFGCKTCHGKDPHATKFKMPSPELPKLDFVALQAGKQEPKMAEFMGKVVKPEMAKILGEKEFDMKDPTAGGFGCLECHEQKK